MLNSKASTQVKIVKMVRDKPQWLYSNLITIPNSNSPLRGGTTMAQTVGKPFCHAWQSPNATGISNKTHKLQIESEWAHFFGHGSVMRLPQSFLLRNDSMFFGVKPCY